jgi:sporulation protein YlmC with PRC-barrel domain
MFNRGLRGYAASVGVTVSRRRIVASEERLRELEDKYEGYTVYDNRGEKIGKVDDLFIDEADREEYIGVKMGFLGRKSTLIPMDIVRVNEADKAIEVSESKDHVKDAPSFDDDEDITPEYEDRIRSHFDLQSQHASSTRGSYGAYSGSGEGERRDASEPSDRDEGTRGESSGVDTEYGEPTGSSTGALGESHTERTDRPSSSQSTTGGAVGGAAGRFERGSSTAGSGGSASSMGSAAEGEKGGAPRIRQTEETETFEEGGRTKVRRRIIREEIVEEDTDSSS